MLENFAKNKNEYFFTISPRWPPRGGLSPAPKQYRRCCPGAEPAAFRTLVFEVCPWESGLWEVVVFWLFFNCHYVFTLALLL